MADYPRAQEDVRERASERRVGVHRGVLDVPECSLPFFNHKTAIYGITGVFLSQFFSCAHPRRPSAPILKGCLLPGDACALRAAHFVKNGFPHANILHGPALLRHCQAGMVHEQPLRGPMPKTAVRNRKRTKTSTPIQRGLGHKKHPQETRP